MFPTLRLALQIDVVGRLVAIVLANTGTDAHPLAVFLTDTIARPTLISIALLLGISRIVCDWMDTEKKKRQLKDLSIEDRNRIEGLVRVGTIFTVLGTFVAAMHIIGIGTHGTFKTCRPRCQFDGGGHQCPAGGHRL